MDSDVTDLFLKNILCFTVVNSGTIKVLNLYINKYFSCSKIITECKLLQQVNADRNNTTTVCPSSCNDTLKFINKMGKQTKNLNYSLGAKWFIYIINATVLLAGCFGNFIVIYALGIRKEKVTIFNLFLSNTCIVALFSLLKQHFANIF